MDHLSRHHSPEAAIEVACHLIDAGFDVYGIGTGPLSNSVGHAQIDRIYRLWARPEAPLGQPLH